MPILEDKIKNSKLIIFDLDGTLIHFPFHYFYEETHRIFKKNNWPEIQQDLLEDCFSDFDYFRFLGDSPAQADMVKKFWLSFDWTNYPTAKLIGDGEDILKQLSKTYLTAIATARFGHSNDLPRELHDLGFFLNFSSLQLRESEALDWQDKLPQIGRILGELNVQPENAIIVGDTPSDILSGKAANLFGTVAVLSGGIKPKVLEESKPSIIVNSIADLPDALTQISFY